MGVLWHCLEDVVDVIRYLSFGCEGCFEFGEFRGVWKFVFEQEVGGFFVTTLLSEVVNVVATILQAATVTVYFANFADTSNHALETWAVIWIFIGCVGAHSFFSYLVWSLPVSTSIF